MNKNWLAGPHALARVALLVLAWAAGFAHAAPPPAEHYSRRPAIHKVAISPSGKRLALIVTHDEGLRRLAVMDLAPIGKLRVIAGVRDGDITSVRWVHDERLVYEAFRRSTEIGDYDAGTFAVNHDGGGDVQLISWKPESSTGTTIASKVLPYGWYLDSTVNDGSDDVLLYRVARDVDGDVRQIYLARLDTRTRRLRNLSEGMPDGTRDVLLDGKGQPRLAVTRKGGQRVVHWRAQAGGEWQVVKEYDPLREEFEPLHIREDGSLLVQARLDDVSALYRFDPASRKLDPEPVVRLKDYDLDPVLEIDSRTRRLMGFHFVADRPLSHWFDPKLQNLQKAIDEVMPAGRSNRLYCGECESTQFFVIRSSSDQQPAEYHLFDRKNLTLQTLGSARPWLDEAAQGRRSFHRYEARDGLRVPMVVTHPAGAAADKPLPTVVLVHGGPFTRGGDLTWDDEAQFLASRGYRVLQPEFRGSTGFGGRHHVAGWKQWGRGMLNDMADAVQWAAKQGMVDAKRVCIVGSSYGGYAALMSPVAHPGVYRCAASYAGVTDLKLLLSFGWSDFTADSLSYHFPSMVGDPGTEADRLAAESPVNRVAELKVPVLLAHGALDRRVPIEHSYRFAKAAKAAGVKLETEYYADEAHGFNHEANRLAYLKRLDAFLATWLNGSD